MVEIQRCIKYLKDKDKKDGKPIRSYSKGDLKEERPAEEEEEEEDVDEDRP